MLAQLYACYVWLGYITAEAYTHYTSAPTNKVSAPPRETWVRARVPAGAKQEWPQPVKVSPLGASRAQRG